MQCGLNCTRIVVIYGGSREKESHMHKKSSNPPAYSLHKASGLAGCRIAGRDHYLGSHGSPESHERYERALAEWRSAHSSPMTPGSSAASASLSVNERLLRYLNHAA